MSITHKKFSVNWSVCFSILLFAFTVSAQETEVNIKLVSNAPAVLLVEGKFTRENKIEPEKSWAFLRSFAGIENLGARVSELKLKDAKSLDISYKKLIDGEYLAENPAVFWSYRINADSLPNEKALAHVSWLKDEQGILMIGDLLPQFNSGNQPISAKIKFELPKDWEILSSENRIAENIFNVANIEKAVFLIGKNWREVKTANENNALDFVISGQWNFFDAEAAQMAREIFEDYCKLFGENPKNKIQNCSRAFPERDKIRTLGSRHARRDFVDFFE